MVTKSEHDEAKKDAKKDGDLTQSQSAYDAMTDAQRNVADTPTVKDGSGIERIVGAATSDWRPAPTEATPEQIEAAKKRETEREKASEQRQALLKGDAKTDGTAGITPSPNVPGDGGSQSPVTPDSERGPAHTKEQQAEQKKAADADKPKEN